MRLRDSTFGVLRGRPCAVWLIAAIALASLWSQPAQAVPPVLQRGYDAGVSGATLAETILDTANVAESTFGLVFKLPVDDAIFAQPLYVPNVVIRNKGAHNVVYVATMSDTLYAFDADAGGAALWSVNLATLVGAVPVPYARFAFSGNKNIVGNLGILSTPVIDASTHIIYVVACTLENNTMAYRLHALDITTGAEPYGPGVLISGSYAGMTFSALNQTQRVSLTLTGNLVVFGFGALESESADGYAGWVMAYDKQTLVQNSAFATVTKGNGGGGVWQSGRPPVVDSAGYVYVFTGNAYGDGYDGVNNFSESALKLDPSNRLKLIDWFTPSNWSDLDTDDRDVSSSGPMLIPSANLLVGGGKVGLLYVLRTANLGKYTSTDSGALQEIQIANQGFRGGPVLWQRSAANGGPWLYDWGTSDALKAYPFNGTKFATAPISQGGGSSQIWPGGILTLSANGAQSGTGVVWATVVISGSAEGDPPVPGELRAFDAEDLTHELWNSQMDAARDSFGNFGKLVPPLVANGKVYVATWSNQVAVYGLLSNYTVAPTSLMFGSQPQGTRSAAQAVTLTNTGTQALPITSIMLSGGNLHEFMQTNTCGTSVAVGSNCTVNVVFKPSATGLKRTNLIVDAGGAGTQSVALSGSGVIASYTLSPASLNFGSQPHGTSSVAQPVTLTNTGTEALPITSITISGTNLHLFSQTNTCGASVAVGSNCTISVVFTPASKGLKAAQLNVNSSSAGLQTATLSGTGS